MTTTKAVQPPRLLEDPPLHVESLLAAAGGEHLHRLICVRADMAEDGLHYGDQWLVVTQTRAIIARQVAGKWSIVNTSIDDVVRAHTEVLVGGGLLFERAPRSRPFLLLLRAQRQPNLRSAHGVLSNCETSASAHQQSPRAGPLPALPSSTPREGRDLSRLHSEMVDDKAHHRLHLSQPLVTRRIIDDDGFPYSTDQRDDDSGVSCSGSGCVDS